MKEVKVTYSKNVYDDDKDAIVDTIIVEEIFELTDEDYEELVENQWEEIMFEIETEIENRCDGYIEESISIYTMDGTFVMNYFEY